MHAPTLVNPITDSQTDHRPHATGGAAVSILAATLFLLPALGVPSELMLQDTLKSAVLAFGTLLAALAWVWQQRRHPAPVRWHPLLALPLVLLLYALGSMLWSHTYLAGVEAIRWFVFCLLLWLVIQVLNRDTLPKLLWGLHAGVTVACVWAALQFWLGLSWFPQAALPASTFANRNFFAEYAVVALPLSVVLLASLSNARSVRWVAASIALNLVAVLMTGTRSALLALMFVLPLLALALWRFKAHLAWGQWSGSLRLQTTAIVVLGVLAWGSIPTHSLTLLQEGQGTSAWQRSLTRSASVVRASEYRQGTFSVRSGLWMATARMLSAHPIVGVGAGAWEVQIPLYQRTDTTLEADYYAHNEFLQLLSEYGMVVGGLVLAFLLAYLIKAIELTWQASGAALQKAPLRAFTLISLLALLIVSNAGFPWHLAGAGMLLALCLGLLAGIDAHARNQDRVIASGLWTMSTRAMYIVLAWLACCLAATAFITGQAVRAESKLVRAITLAKDYARAQHFGLPTAPEIKKQALQSAREGIAINPHYRKLTGEIAEPFAALGDWQSATFILASITTSRPHVLALWTGLVNGYAALGEYDHAEQAFAQVHRLRPDALTTATLHATMLSQAGRGPEAAAVLNSQFDDRMFDRDMTQAGYAIGYKTENWSLAIRSLELQNATWPEQSASGFFRLGKLYAEPQVADTTKALQAFKAGFAAVPAEERPNYLSQVPKPFREQM